MKRTSLFNSPLTRTLLGKLALFGIAVSCLLVLLNTVYEYHEKYEHLDKVFENIKKNDLAAITQSTWTTNQKEAEHLVKAISEKDYVEMASIITNKETWVSSGRVYSEELLKQSIPLTYQKGERHYELGSLNVVFSIDQVNEKIYKTITESLIYSFSFVSLLILFILAIFESLVTRHIVSLADYIDKLVPGHKKEDFELDRVKTGKTDELDKLSNSINTLKNSSHEFLQELIASQEKYQAIADYTYDWESWHDPDGKLIWVNPAVERITGYTIEDCFNMPDYPLAIIDSKDQELVREIFFASDKDESPGNDLTIQIKRKGGEKAWVALSWLPVYNDSHVYQGIRSSFRDVTERMKAESAFYKSETRFHNLVNSVPGVTYRCEYDENFTVHYISAEIQKLSGYPASDFIMNAVRSYISIIHPGDLDHIKQVVADSLEHARGFSFEYRIIRKNGAIAYVYGKGRGVFDEEKQQTFLEGVIIDITDKKLAIHDIERQKTEHERVLNTMAESVITVDDSGVILSANKATTELFEYTESELVGANVSMLMPEKYAANHHVFIQNLATINTPRQMGKSRSIVGLKKSGEEFPIRITIAELPSTGSNEKSYVGVCHDITHELLHEEQMRRSQKMDAVGQLTGGIAHDFNNALGIILGYLELCNELVDNKQLGNYMENIEGAAKRAANLTSQLLTFSKSTDTTPDIVNLNETIEHAKDMIEKALTARISLYFDLSPEQPLVYIDKSNFEDALLNMSINAMHAMEDSGDFTIATRLVTLSATERARLGLDDGEYAVVTLTDTGHGMDSSVREKLFDPFFSTKGENGTGLGLSRVYGFVQQSGGAIDVSSSPGNGTTFILYFPVFQPEKHDSEISSQPAIAEKTSHTDSLSILVVDDEPALLTLAEVILTKHGHNVQTANSGKNALKIIEKNKIDLLISDVIMPEMTGNQLVQELVKRDIDLPVIMISGYSKSADKAVDISKYNLRMKRISKPYHEKELITAIDDLMND